MTEVRQIIVISNEEKEKKEEDAQQQYQVGLFATRDYLCGDVLLEETIPLITLVPNETDIDDDDDARMSFLKELLSSSNDRSSVATLIMTIPIPTEIQEDYHGTYRGMIMVGLYYYSQHYYMHRHHASLQQPQQQEEILSQLFSLYHPSLLSSSSSKDDQPQEGTFTKLERKLVDIADCAVQYITTLIMKHRNRKNSNMDDAPFEITIKKVMLIWACNSFEGGRIYLNMSRTNHDCNPNAVIQPIVSSNDKDKTSASVSVSGTGTRTRTGDNNNGQRMVAVTDICCGEEITISYLGLLLYTGTACRQHKLRTTKFFDCTCERCCTNDTASRIPDPVYHPRSGNTSTDSCGTVLSEDVQYDDDQTVQYTTIATMTTTNTDQLQHQHLTSVITKVTNKIMTYLDSVQCSNKNKSRGAMHTNKKKANDDNDDDDNDDEQILEDYLSLANTVLGDKHWTTNVLRLLYLDRTLLSMSSKMIVTQEIPDLDELGMAIDSLERIVRFVKDLGLKIDLGFLLDDVIIGVGRMLVSLGDPASQHYATEWLAKIEKFITKFEYREGRKKVVAALKNKNYNSSNSHLEGEGENRHRHYGDNDDGSKKPAVKKTKLS